MLNNFITYLSNNLLPKEDISIFKIIERNIEEIKIEGNTSLNINKLYFHLELNPEKFNEIKIKEECSTESYFDESENDLISPELSLKSIITTLIEEKMLKNITSCAIVVDNP